MLAAFTVYTQNFIEMRISQPWRVVCRPGVRTCSRTLAQRSRFSGHQDAVMRFSARGLSALLAGGGSRKRTRGWLGYISVAGGYLSGGVTAC
jgi:hypothetical protein